MANTSSIQQQITAAATAAGIPPSLALAVAQVESNFNPNAVSPPNSNGTQDYGVFQINSSNLTSLGLTNPLDPTQNINAGVSLLANLYNQYDGDLTQVLWAYNAGPTSVASGTMPPSTQSYVPAVLAAQSNYGTTLPDDDTDLSDLGLTSTSTDSTDLSSTVSSFLTGDVSLFGVDVPGYAVAGGAALLFLGLWYALAD